MGPHSELDRVFAALADPTRRRVLLRLGAGPATIGELAEPAGMSLTGMTKHIRVLESAGLVVTEKVGRSRRCRLGSIALDQAGAWIADYQRLWVDARPETDGPEPSAAVRPEPSAAVRPEPDSEGPSAAAGPEPDG